MRKSVIPSGLARSEESPGETRRNSASLRVTGFARGDRDRKSRTKSGKRSLSPEPQDSGGSQTRPYDPDPTPRLRVADDEAVEAALLRSALGGDFRAQVFWLVNRAPLKWRPVGRMSFLPRLPSVASMLRVAEPRLREWAYRARSRNSSRGEMPQPRLGARASRRSGHSGRSRLDSFPLRGDNPRSGKRMGGGCFARGAPWRLSVGRTSGSRPCSTHCWRRIARS